MRLALTLLLMTLASGAQAGAWLQEHKKGFLSYSIVYEETGRLDGTFYAEYGARPKLTLGAKIDAQMTLGRLGGGTGFLFFRKPIPTGDRDYKLAYDIGIGGTFRMVMEPLLRTGLSYGRGIKLGERHGWVALDGAVEWALDEGPNTLKLDSTIGLGINDRFKVMMQVFATSADSNTSVIWQPKPDGASFVLGVEDEDGILALKLGLWRSF